MDNQFNNLKDVSVVITGAARGLGAALALTLADAGCNVILCGRSHEALEGLADQIEKRTGQRPASFILDLADAERVVTSAHDMLNHIPTVDVLINNGAAWLEHRETPYSPAEVASVVNSMLTGTFLFTQGLIPALQKSARPDVVTIGSVSGLPNVGLFGVSVPFYAAKHGQTALADGLRQMFLGTPIRSICIHPPWIEEMTPLDAEWDNTPTRTKTEKVTDRDIVEAVIFAITRPRHVTIASLVIDSDVKGIDFRSH